MPPAKIGYTRKRKTGRSFFTDRKSRGGEGVRAKREEDMKESVTKISHFKFLRRRIPSSCTYRRRRPYNDLHDDKVMAVTWSLYGG